jgi:hypothetical protein
LSTSRLVIGPGLPQPITRPSIFTMGINSAPVPLRKHALFVKLGRIKLDLIGDDDDGRILASVRAETKRPYATL